MDKITIRAELNKDYGGIKRIHDLNFKHTTESTLINELRKEDSFDPNLSVVIEKDSGVIGHALLSPITIDNQDEQIKALVLAPVGILLGHQGLGYGNRLITSCLEIAKESGYDIVLVYGGDYYKKFGFEKAKYVFRPNPIIGHGILIKTFNDVDPNQIRGVIHYPRPFKELIHEWDK